VRRRAKQSSGEESGEELGAKKFLKDSRVIFLFCLQLLEEPSSKRKPKAKAGGKGKTKGKVATSKKTAPADDSNDGTNASTTQPFKGSRSNVILRQGDEAKKQTEGDSPPVKLLSSRVIIIHPLTGCR